MSYIREYIRICLFEEGTNAFGEYPMMYDPESVLLESSNLREGFEEIISENMELAYFNKNFEDEVNGAAWISDGRSRFEFGVVTSEEAPVQVFESLVRDCMEEYFTLKEGNEDLRLEVKVEDEETEKHLSRVYGLSLLETHHNFAVMGYGK